jgi:hypothetical protein
MGTVAGPSKLRKIKQLPCRSGDCRKFWGQAAIAIGGYGALASRNLCLETGAESAIVDGATNLK